MTSSYKKATSVVASLVKRCTTVFSLRVARCLHALLITAPREKSYTPYLNNNVLSMYVRSGSVKDAQKLFDKMPHRSLVSYNAMISAYLQENCGGAAECFRFFSRLRVDEGFMTPNQVTFMSLMQAASLLGDRWAGSMLHCLAMKSGCYDDVPVQTSMVMMYSSCGDLGSSREVFHDMEYRDPFAWDGMVIGLMKNDRIEDALDLYGYMLRSNVAPSQFTYTRVLNGCAKLGDFNVGRLVHAQVIVSGITLDLPLQNALLDMYCCCGNIKKAFMVFNRIDIPDVVTWNTMIGGCSENEDGEKAMHLFVQFLRGSCLRPDEYTYAAVVSGLGGLPCLQYGKPLHAQVSKMGFEESIYVGSTLVLMYLRNGETELAHGAFSLVPDKDAILWTEMITGHSQIEDHVNAIKFYHEMCQAGHKIDSYSISGALSGCANLATLRQGEMIHLQAIKTGYHREMSVCGSLIDMHAKNGQLESAKLIFSLLDNPDIKCWNSMLGGYSNHGNATESFKLFYQMVAKGLQPDEVTYISLLSACSHCGLTSDAKLIWSDMKARGIIPGLKHYSCMASLLCRAGLLEEVKQLMDQSAYVDNIELWRSILSSCVQKGNLEIGVHAAEQILRLDPKDSATHKLLSNLYAATGRWDGVANIRRMTRELALDKNPGLSWIESGNDIHAFASGDKSRSDVDQLENELQRLQGNMIKNL